MKNMPSDIEIAQNAQLKSIADIAEKLGIHKCDLSYMGLQSQNKAFFIREGKT